MKHKLTLFAAILLAGGSLTACIVDPGYYGPHRRVLVEPPPVYSSAYPAPVVVERRGPVYPAPVVVAPPPGPPPWVPRYGFVHPNHYQYYYRDQVYYNLDHHEYVWLDGGRWVVGARLPDRIHLSLDGVVTLDLEGRHPDVYHNQVIRVYPREYRVERRGGPDRDNGPGRGDPGRGNNPPPPGRGRGPGG